jgi:hypothetical protein
MASASSSSSSTSAFDAIPLPAVVSFPFYGPHAAIEREQGTRAAFNKYLQDNAALFRAAFPPEVKDRGCQKCGNPGNEIIHAPKRADRDKNDEYYQKHYPSYDPDNPQRLCFYCYRLASDYERASCDSTVELRGLSCHHGQTDICNSCEYRSDDPPGCYIVMQHHGRHAKVIPKRKAVPDSKASSAKPLASTDIKMEPAAAATPPPPSTAPPSRWIKPQTGFFECYWCGRYKTSGSHQCNYGTTGCSVCHQSKPVPHRAILDFDFVCDDCK